MAGAPGSSLEAISIGPRELFDDSENNSYVLAMAEAARLRAQRRGKANSARVADEIDAMDRGEDRELVSRLAVLLLTLLKWRFQPGFRSSTGSSSIREQRIRLRSYLRDNPGLKARLGDVFGEAYELAVIVAARETDLPESAFPDTAPYHVEQAVDDAFWP